MLFRSHYHDFTSNGSFVFYYKDAVGNTDIIQVALILSAIDTALQAFAPFRRIGGGLPIVMGVSFAFLPALQAMGASGFSFGALLGGEIVGGAVAVLFGLAYSKIKWLFPPKSLRTPNKFYLLKNPRNTAPLRSRSFFT